MGLSLLVSVAVTKSKKRDILLVTYNKHLLFRIRTASTKEEAALDGAAEPGRAGIEGLLRLVGRAGMTGFGAVTGGGRRLIGGGVADVEETGRAAGVGGDDAFPAAAAFLASS